MTENILEFNADPLKFVENMVGSDKVVIAFMGGDDKDECWIKHSEHITICELIFIADTLNKMC